MADQPSEEIRSTEIIQQFLAMLAGNMNAWFSGPLTQQIGTALFGRGADDDPTGGVTPGSGPHHHGPARPIGDVRDDPAAQAVFKGVINAASATGVPEEVLFKLAYIESRDNLQVQSQGQSLVGTLGQRDSIVATIKYIEQQAQTQQWAKDLLEKNPNLKDMGTEAQRLLDKYTTTDSYLEAITHNNPDLEKLRGYISDPNLKMLYDAANARQNLEALGYKPDANGKFLVQGTPEEIAAAPGKLLLTRMLGIDAAKDVIARADRHEKDSGLSDDIIKINPYLKGLSSEEVLAWANQKANLNVSSLLNTLHGNPAVAANFTGLDKESVGGVSIGVLKQAIFGNESSAYSHPYQIQNDRTHASGKYQIMPNNIDPWSREAGLGPMSVQQFLNNPEAQEQITAFKFKQYIEKSIKRHGGQATRDQIINDVSAYWHSGVNYDQAVAEHRNDGHWSTETYSAHAVDAYAKLIDRYAPANGIGGQVPYTFFAGDSLMVGIATQSLRVLGSAHGENIAHGSTGLGSWNSGEKGLAALGWDQMKIIPDALDRAIKAVRTDNPVRFGLFIGRNDSALAVDGNGNIKADYQQNVETIAAKMKEAQDAGVEIKWIRPFEEPGSDKAASNVKQKKLGDFYDQIAHKYGLQMVGLNGASYPRVSDGIHMGTDSSTRVAQDSGLLSPGKLQPMAAVAPTQAQPGAIVVNPEDLRGLARGLDYRISQLRLPVDGAQLTSPFGPRVHPIEGKDKHHDGDDLAVPEGTEVVAAGAGVIHIKPDNGGYGNFILIDHGNGLQTAYGHLHGFAPDLKEGQIVSQGQLIGTVGHTGGATGPHLHFEVRINGLAVDPLTPGLVQQQYAGLSTAPNITPVVARVPQPSNQMLVNWDNKWAPPGKVSTKDGLCKDAVAEFVSLQLKQQVAKDDLSEPFLTAHNYKPLYAGTQPPPIDSLPLNTVGHFRQENGFAGHWQVLREDPVTHERFWASDFRQVPQNRNGIYPNNEYYEKNQPFYLYAPPDAPNAVPLPDVRTASALAAPPTSGITPVAYVVPSTPTAPAPAITPASYQPAPTSSGSRVTDDKSLPAYAIYSNGQMIGNRINDPSKLASGAKVLTYYGSLTELKKRRVDVNQFVAENKPVIDRMLDHSDNNAANSFAQAVKQKLGIGSDQELKTIISGHVHAIHVGNEQVSNNTQYQSFAGGGQTTAHDLSLIMYEARQKFPDLFRNNNQYHTDTYNRTSVTFGKPGLLKDGSASYVAALPGQRGTMAVLTKGEDNMKTGIDLAAKNLLPAPIPTQAKALAAAPAQTVAHAPADTVSGISIATLKSMIGETIQEALLAHQKLLDEKQKKEQELAQANPDKKPEDQTSKDKLLAGNNKPPKPAANDKEKHMAANARPNHHNPLKSKSGETTLASGTGKEPTRNTTTTPGNVA